MSAYLQLKWRNKVLLHDACGERRMKQLSSLRRRACRHHQWLGSSPLRAEGRLAPSLSSQQRPVVIVLSPPDPCHGRRHERLLTIRRLMPSPRRQGQAALTFRFRPSRFDIRFLAMFHPSAWRSSLLPRTSPASPPLHSLPSTVRHLFVINKPEPPGAVRAGAGPTGRASSPPFPSWPPLLLPRAAVCVLVSSRNACPASLWAVQGCLVALHFAWAQGTGTCVHASTLPVRSST